MSLPFGLQLYTVRDHMEQDPRATLKAVKTMGYDTVETAGLAGLSAAAFRELLDEFGLRAFSMHVGIDALAEDVDQQIETAKTLGADFLVVPWIGGEETSDRAAWEQYAKEMDVAGEAVRGAGLKLCYHNHAHEFALIGGDTVFDIIFNTAAPENLAAEIDVYWVKHAGYDPAAVIQQYTDRCPIVHFKDMTPAEPHTFTELGQGVIDWPAMVETCKKAGVQWCVVEQDLCSGDSLESARVSAEFMATLS